MNQNKFTFESENLVVDWISFKFQDLDNPTMMQIANYLFKIGFNSYQQSGKLTKPIKESLLVSDKNKYEVYFVGDNSYWGVTLLHFSGLNATRFYFFSKKQIIDWTIFSSGVLSRFDIYYSRKNKNRDKTSVTDFFENCQRKLKQTNKNVSFEKNTKGLIFKIGNRKGNNYYQIYEDKNSLKFEYEMKGRVLREYHLLLVANRFEEFESELFKRFLHNFGKILPLHYSYVDWLVVKLRPIRKQKFFSSSLKLHYLETNNFWTDIDRKNFFNLLHFIVYAQSLDYQIASLGSTSYRQVIFRVQDFLKYKKESDNYYQLKKMIKFFDELQTNSLIKFFSDTQYRSLVTIPEVKLEKDKQNYWIAEVWIAQELFIYAHPFILPDFLKPKLTKHEVQVQFKFIQVFSSVDIQKTFDIKDFFQNYPSTLTNQDRTKMKNHFIRLLKVFEECQLVNSKYTIISDGNVSDTNQLTARNISEGFILTEKLFI